MITDEQQDEIEQRCIKFTVAHLEETRADHPGEPSMFYTGVMASTVLAWVIDRYGTRSAVALMGVLAEVLLKHLSEEIHADEHEHRTKQ